MPTRYPHLLVVDDERSRRDAIRVALEEDGFRVAQASGAEEALRRLREDLPDLVLLHLDPRTGERFAVLEQLRALSVIPLIVLSTRDAEADHVRGLELGADDYVTTSVSPTELAARIRVVLRRCVWSGGLHTGLVRVDDRLQIDFDEREVVVAGRRVALRPTEHRLLYHLVQNAGHTVPFATILARVWGPAYREETQYVHLYVAYLRHKLEPEPARPEYILTRRGVGYRFRPLPPAEPAPRRPAAGPHPQEPPPDPVAYSQDWAGDAGELPG
jgi:two-component system KDP operon response regulator KdpE